MSRHIAHTEGNRRQRRLAVGVAFAGLGLAITGIGVYAGLAATASNSSAQTISSGTLKLVYADNGTGFTTGFSNMAPGDVINRYVDLSNTGTLTGKALTLAASDSSVTKLTNDATNGLHVTVTSCSTVWVAATGTCTLGTTSVLLNNVAVSALRSSASSLVSGAVASGYKLKFSVTLPDQDETTTNGTLPGSTIQGLTANITWSFSESQRDATTTDS
jgi:hypothetical protein